jgi:hypothetical protein
MDKMRNAVPPPLWVRAADMAVFGLLLFALAIWISGGFVLHPIDGVRLPFRSEWRVVAWAAGVVVLRHLCFRQPAIHSRLGSALRAAARAQQALPLDGLLGRPAATPMQVSLRTVVLRALGVIVLFWGLTIVMTYPQIRMLDRGVRLELGDPLLSTWRLSWVAHQLPRDARHLFDGNIFYPEKNTLAFSDATIVPSLMAAPLIWMGVHQLIVYNLLLLSGFALSGAAMFLLAHSLTRHVGAALVAGFVFAFLPFRYMHYGHLELQMAQWMPLCLWAFHRTVKDGRLRDGLATGVFLALQTLSSLYYGIFFAIYLIPIGTALVIGARRVRFWMLARTLAVGALLAVVLVVPFARPYLAARRSVGERPLDEVKHYSAMPDDYLVADQWNTFFGHLSQQRALRERTLFEGFVVPTIAIAALWPPLTAARIGYAAGLALAFELSLGTNGTAYPWLWQHVVVIRGLRVPARMAIVVGLSLAILVGYAVARISRAARSRVARVGAVALIALAIAAEYHSTLVLDNVWREPPSVYDALRGHPDAVLLELPLASPVIAQASVYMYFSTFHWHRLVNGYSGFIPRWYPEFLNRMAAFPDDNTIEDLRRRGVDYVIVHAAFYAPDDYRRLTTRLDERRDIHLEAVTQRETDETRLYRLVR